MSSRPDPMIVVVKVVAVALAGWLFFIVFRASTEQTPSGGKRENVLRKIMNAAKDLRLQSPYTNDQLQQRVKDYTGK